jgi:hypothetical protein
MQPSALQAVELDADDEAAPVVDAKSGKFSQLDRLDLKARADRFQNTTDSVCCDALEAGTLAVRLDRLTAWKDRLRDCETPLYSPPRSSWQPLGRSRRRQNQVGSLTSGNLNASDLTNAMASTDITEFNALRSNDTSFAPSAIGRKNRSLSVLKGGERLDLTKPTAMSAQIETLNPPIKP